MQNILIVDDEPDVRDARKRVLDLAGYSVRTAANAMDAMAELERIPADVVITDIIMPKINGVQAIELICKAFPTIRIIAISGGAGLDITAHKRLASASTACLVAAQGAGTHLVHTKPFESVELIQAVEQ